MFAIEATNEPPVELDTQLLSRSNECRALYGAYRSSPDSTMMESVEVTTQFTLRAYKLDKLRAQEKKYQG